MGAIRPVTTHGSSAPWFAHSAGSIPEGVRTTTERRKLWQRTSPINMPKALQTALGREALPAHSGALRIPQFRPVGETESVYRNGHFRAFFMSKFIHLATLFPDIPRKY